MDSVQASRNVLQDLIKEMDKQQRAGLEKARMPKPPTQEPKDGANSNIHSR